MAIKLIENLQVKGASQKEIAQLLGVSPSMLSKLKSKDYFPKNGTKLIERLQYFCSNDKVLYEQLENQRFNNNALNFKSILVDRKNKERTIIIILSLVIVVLVYSLMSNIDLYKENRINEEIVTKVFGQELEKEIASLVSNLTLASPTFSQKKKIKIINSRFASLNSLTKGQSISENIDSIMVALNKLIINRNADGVVKALERVEEQPNATMTKSIALVLLGYAHHIRLENIEGTQSFSEDAMDYFEDATHMDHYTFGAAYNGLAVQKAMWAFFHLSRNEESLKSFTYLRQAEEHFKTASEIDDASIGYYKELNNLTYIKATLFSFMLKKRITQKSLLEHVGVMDLEHLIKQIERGCKEAEILAYGSPAAPFTTAECHSIIGEYYLQRKNDAKKAQEHFDISKAKLIEAMDKDIYEGKSRDQIREILLKEAMLQSMLKNGNNLKDILSLKTNPRS